MQGIFSEGPAGEVGEGIGTPNEDEDHQNGTSKVVGSVPNGGEIWSGFGTQEAA